jgi:peptidyl-tRNA hydrolase
MPAHLYMKPNSTSRSEQEMDYKSLYHESQADVRRAEFKNENLQAEVKKAQAATKKAKKDEDEWYNSYVAEWKKNQKQKVVTRDCNHEAQMCEVEQNYTGMSKQYDEVKAKSTKALKETEDAMNVAAELEKEKDLLAEGLSLTLSHRKYFPPTNSFRSLNGTYVSRRISRL